MSLELVREAINICQVIGEESTQTILENDIIVPDIKPDVARILFMDGSIVVDNVQTLDEKIAINGTVNYRILYTCEDSDSNIGSINTSSAFSHSINVPTARHGMRSKAMCDIVHIEHNILNGRKINTKTIVSINGRVTEEIEYGAVSDLKGIEEVQILKNNAYINCFIGESKSNVRLEESLEVPAGKPTIKEILRNNIRIVGKDYKTDEDRIIVKGELNVSTLYLSDDELQSIQSMEHEMPFSQTLDMTGVNEETICEIGYEISQSRFEAEEDSDGELRFMNGEISIGISVEASAAKSIETVADAYAQGVDLTIEKESISFREATDHVRNQVVIKDTLYLEGDSPEIVEVLSLICKPGAIECKAFEKIVAVEGVINNSMLYVSNDTGIPINCCDMEIPFKNNIDIDGVSPGARYEASIDVEHCTYSIVSLNEVEVRLVMNLSVRAVDVKTVELIKKVSESPADGSRYMNRPSILVYFTQPGDSIWGIAKRYRIKAEDILSFNNISEKDSLLPGEQIVIPKRF